VQREKLIPTLAEKKLKWLVIVCALAALCLSQAALAQSGRRQSKNASPSTPITTDPKTEPAPGPPAVKPTPASPAASIIIGGDRIGSSTYLVASYVDEVVRACMDRLRETQGLEVKGGGDMNRKAAIDRAKKETNASVLWIQLRIEEDGSNSISISYTLFTPQTAKVLTSGNVNPAMKGVGSGGVIIGLPSPTGRLPLQYQLKEGGREVANRIRGKLH
jgi:hypothetical protein